MFGSRHQLIIQMLNIQQHSESINNRRKSINPIDSITMSAINQSISNNEIIK